MWNRKATQLTRNKALKQFILHCTAYAFMHLNFGANFLHKNVLLTMKKFLIFPLRKKLFTDAHFFIKKF